MSLARTSGSQDCVRQPSVCDEEHTMPPIPSPQLVTRRRFLRDTAAAAKAAGVVTQMGTQNHANANFRRVVELIQAGAVGPVRECHVWVSRAWGWQTQEEAKKNKDVHWVTMDRPKVGMTPPRSLDW